MASLGGKARAAKMTKQERSESARRAVNARWEKTLDALEKKNRAHAKAAKKNSNALAKNG